MPCNSDYLNPTQDELNKILVSKLIRYVDRKLEEKTPNKIIKVSRDVYGKGVDLNIIVPALCSKLKSLSNEQKEEIIYNAKDKTSRDLADWWEEHQNADKERKKLEKEEKNKKSLVSNALSKLTPKEKKALGI